MNETLMEEASNALHLAEQTTLRLQSVIRKLQKPDFNTIPEKDSDGTKIKLYTVKEVEKILGISETALWKLRRMNEISYYQRERKILFSENHIQEYLNSIEKKAM